MLLHKRPSPALVIACLALFVSLGGVSYGVATGFIDSREIANNTIRSKDIRNSTIRTQDIHNNEVRGFDVRNSSIQGRDVAFNTLTGADIEESSLGKVPSAATADSATSIATLKTFTRRVLPEGSPPVTLLTHGPLTLSLACLDQGTMSEGDVRVQSTEAGTLGSTGDGTIDPADGPSPVAGEIDVDGGPKTAGAHAVSATAPSGKGLSGTFGIVVDAAGAGTCTFNGHVVLEG
jgi:hypothetical protein